MDHLAAIEVNDSVHDWTVLAESLSACCSVVSGLLAFITLHSNKRLMFEDSVGPGTYINNTVVIYFCVYFDFFLHQTLDLAVRSTANFQLGSLEKKS